MAKQLTVCILMRDKTGRGPPSKDGEKSWQCTVNKGELILEIPDEERETKLEKGQLAANYRLYSEPEIVFYARPADVSPLEEGQLDYLLAVQPATVRLQEYLREDKKKEKTKLIVGDRVMFKLSTQPRAPESIVNGLIRYIGPLPEREGFYFGIEILEEQYRGKGTTNGRPHFNCDPNNAVYVAMNKIMKKSEYTHSSADQSVPKRASQNPALKGRPADNTRSFGKRIMDMARHFDDSAPVAEANDDVSSHQSQFQVGDRVVLQSVKGDTITGTVRWVGSVKISKEVSVPPIPAVGVETDRNIDPNAYFPDLHIDMGSLGPKLFKVSSNHSRVFLPEMLVVHAETFAEQQEKENATQYEAKLAKEYGVSLEEYRSQKELFHEANLQRGTRKSYRDTSAADYQQGRNEADDNHSQHDSSSLDPIREGERREKYSPRAAQRATNRSPQAAHRDIDNGGPTSLPSISNIPPPPVTKAPLQFTIGSRVSVPTQRGQPLQGVVQWIGTHPDIPDTIAGVELEEPLTGCTDGTWQGICFFNCPPGRAFFCPVTALQQDTRYIDEGQIPANLRDDLKNPLDYVPTVEEYDTMFTPELFTKYIGDGHGIQGHHNSCYLDSTVFGLFALSESFDELLLEEPREEVGREVKYFLWKGIVNPLRKYGLARHESVMSLRNSLEEFGRMKGAKTDAEDPEEFLNLLFKEVLHVEPFLSIKRPFGVEKEYFVQLFFEIDPKETQIPKTDKLLAQMFHEQKSFFTRVPSKLLLQMPRFGKEFKMYNSIIPSLKIDVKPLLDPSSRGSQQCYICLVRTGSCVCYNCAKDIANSDNLYIFFCSLCNERVHRRRKGHRIEEVTVQEEEAGGVDLFSKLELLSVICIETSHYVCYTRSGDRWLFHDSMADRYYDMYNIPKVVDVTQELQDWVYSEKGTEKLMTSPAKNIPEYVRCFTQDIYMCVYVNPDLDMYGAAPSLPVGVTGGVYQGEKHLPAELRDHRDDHPNRADQDRARLGGGGDDYYWSEGKRIHYERDRATDHRRARRGGDDYYWSEEDQRYYRYERDRGHIGVRDQHGYRGNGDRHPGGGYYGDAYPQRGGGGQGGSGPDYDIYNS